jgi:hypothetical protein
MNQTPEKSGVIKVARDLTGLGCGVVWENRTAGKVKAAAKNAETMKGFRTVRITPVSHSALDYLNPCPSNF